ncbi:MAG: hypothetical protein DRJ40_05070 [Thermoprotei archaeon]|nr:MAG: hypothetical protein DRJ40_04455 [Thermoprotei archaeon]RLE56770.1 MAG: hypothetical protein DRJ40_05070 [Thermoprotei archaeon]
MEVNPIIKARVVIKGSRRVTEGNVLVDTGATYSIIDEELANEIGVKLLERPERILLRGICCQIEGRLCVIDTLIIEDITVGPSVAVLTRLSTEVKEILKSYEVLNTFILGLRDIVGFTIDVKSGRLKWVGYLAL